MHKKLKYFVYSQNSLNTFKSCPKKFKYKYIDKINWKFDDVYSRDYYEGLKKGRDFHLLCERYFNKIPVGYNIDKKFEFWLNKVKKIIPIEEDKIYLPEYEVRSRILESNLLAKYDLIVIGKDSIEIWDWKTESNNSNYKNIENRMQTIVYMFLAREVIQKIYNMDIDIENISMNYFRIKLDEKPIKVKYSEAKHLKNKETIENYIKTIEKIDFDKDVRKNEFHCKYCEFNKLCNNQAINYKLIQEDDDGA